MSEATVDITDVVPAAQRIPVTAIVSGDKVFDTFGRTYDVIDVKMGANGRVYIKRADNPSVWDCIGDETITIIPSLRARSTT